MGSQASPSVTKLKRDSPTIRTVGPHRRTSSVSSSCVSLESGDQDMLHSPARSSSTGPRKSPAASSPRTPAAINLGEKSAMKKQRSSIGGADDLVRGLDFSTTNSSSPNSEEKKLHSFLTKGGGHKKVVQAASVTGQGGSPGKKMGTTPPGKEKLVAGRATSVLSPRRLSDGRELSKKDIISARKSVSALEGSSMNGMAAATSDINAEHITAKKSSPLRVSSDSGKMGIKPSSPRHLSTKFKSELVVTKGRTSLNGEFTAAVDHSAAAEAETKSDYKFSPGISQDGKSGRKPSPRPSSRSKSSFTSPTGRRVTKTRQDTPSPPQLGRARSRNEKTSPLRSEELLTRPEMESVEVPVYAEYEFERETKQAENAVELSHEMPVPLQHGEADEERLTLLASLMDGENVEDEDMSSLEQGVEPGFGTDTELLPTSWLSEDLPCMFSSLSHLPEPDDSRANLLGDPPEVLDEPVQVSSSANIVAVPNGIIAAEVAKTLVVSSPKNPLSTTDHGKLVAGDDAKDASNGVHQFSVDKSAWIYESNDPGDEFEAELRTQLDASNELDSPQLSVPHVEDPGDKFEAELRTQIDTTFESPRLLVQPTEVVPVAITKESLLTVGNGETMPYKFATHPEDISSSTSDNESYVSEVVANEFSLQSCTSQVAEPTLQSGEGEREVISSQNGKDPAEESLVVPTVMEGDRELFHRDPTKPMSFSAPDMSPPVQEGLEGRLPRVEDEIRSTSQDQYNVLGSSDDEFLEETLDDDSDSAQVNLKQSFDDVAEPLVVSRNKVTDEIDMSHDANNVSTVLAMASPQNLALSTEPEFGAEFLDGQDCAVFSPIYLDQDMKIFEEYWTQSVADEFSQSDAGQNDAEDLQPSTSVSESQVDDEAEKSLPPVELPISTLPGVGKLKLTVEEPITLDSPPGYTDAEVNATKVEIVEETLPREGWPCPVSVLASGVDTESPRQVEVEEFDEVFHMFGGSEELVSPSRPNVSPVHSDSSPKETRFENECDSSLSPRYTAPTLRTEHPQVMLDLQDRDVEGDADISTKSFAVQEASVDPHCASISGAAEDPADQELILEALGRPPIVAVHSNDFTGVNIRYLDGDDAPDDHSSIRYLHQLEGPEKSIIEDSDSLLGAAVDEGAFETPDMSETHTDVHTSNEVFGLGPVNPYMAQEFCASSVQAPGGGDRNPAQTGNEERLMLGDCINDNQGSIDRDFSGVIAQVDSEADDSHKISPNLSILEDDQAILVSSPSAAATANEVDLSDSIAQLPPVSGVNDDKQTEAEFLSSLRKEEESIYGAIHSEDRHDGTASTLGERQEIIEKPIPGLDQVQMRFAQEERQGLFSSVEGSETIKGYSDGIPNGEPLLDSTELEDNFQTMSSSESIEVIKVEVPEQDTPQIHGDDEFQDGERVATTALQIVADSQKDVNMSEVDHEPQILELTSPQGSETLEEYSTEDGDSGYISTVAAEAKSPPTEALDESTTHDLNAACIPVSSEEDDIIPDKFDAESEVNSIAFPEMAIPATDEATNNYSDNTASFTEILGKGEATHVVATPFVLSANELPSTNLNEVDEFNRHESEFEVNEDISMAGDQSEVETVDYGEQGRAEQDWEGSLLAVHSSGSKTSTEDKWDLLREESIIISASRSAVADASRDTTEDLEIDQDKSEEAWSNISTSGSTPSELTEYHDPILHGTQLSLETITYSDDQVSRTEDAPGAEKALEVLSDADFDEDTSEAGSNGYAHDVEITPESRCTQDLLSQDTQNADAVKEDSDFSWKGDNHEERLNGILEQNRLPKDVDTVVDSAEESVVDSDQDTAINVDVDEMEEDSTFSRKTERENVYLNGGLGEEPLFEDEEAMAISPKDLYSDASGPDTEHLGADDIRNHSSVSWTADKDEESLHGNVTKESFLEDEDTVVHSPKDITLNAATSDADNTQNHSTASDSEKDYSDESLKDEDMPLDSSKKPFVVSEKNVAILDTDGMEGQSNVSSNADKDDEMESLEEEEDAFLECEDTVVYIPMESSVTSDQDLPGTAILVDDKVERYLKSSEQADEEGKENGAVTEEAVAEVMVDAMPDAEETVVDDHDEANLVVQMNTNAEALIVDDLENRESWRDEKEEEESSNGNTFLEKESMFEVQKMVDHYPSEPYSAPHLLNANAEDLNVDEMGKHRTWRTDDGGATLEEKSKFNVEEAEAMDSRKESLVSSDGDNTNATISDEDGLEKHSTWTTEKKGESLNRNLEEGDSVLEVQENVMDSSGGNLESVLVCQGPEAKQIIVNGNSDYNIGGDLVCHLQTEDSAMTLHEGDEDAVHISTPDVVNAQVVNIDHVDDDQNSDHEEFSRAAAVADHCKSTCVIPEMTNGNHLHEFDDSGAVNAEKTSFNDNSQDVESLEEATEPHSPEATMYPLLASQPPFSGSQQDRLWEEQAEAYSSGGRGTPARNEDHASQAAAAAAPFHPPSSSSPPGDQLAESSSDDQIQPASTPTNNISHVEPGPPNPGAGENGSTLQSEPKGKGKLHTPLRSLLLEDASKVADGDPSTPNAVTSSPSFIKRLFRVMSTPSRSAERDASSQTKHKKSMSMWVSCLGSPQVQQ